MQKELIELYRNWNEELKSKCPELLSEDFSNPHYIYIPDEWEYAKNRVMIVGEEGCGAWGQGKQSGLTLNDFEAIQNGNGKTVNQILAKDNDYRKFWQRFKHISDLNVPCIWNNLDKIYYIGKERSKHCLSTEEENILHSTDIKILKEEIDILKPSIVVFFGWYNNALHAEMPEIWEKLCSDKNAELRRDRFCKISVGDISYIFTNHPSWRGKYKPTDYEQRIISFIANCLCNDKAVPKVGQ